MILPKQEIKEIYAQYYEPCVKFSLNNSGTENEAESIYKESYVAFLKSLLLHKKEIKDVGAYLYGIHKNLWYKFLLEKKEKLSLDKVPIDKLVSLNEYTQPDRVVDKFTYKELRIKSLEGLKTIEMDKEDLQNLERHRNLIQNLKGNSRCNKILKLFYFKKQSYKEIAKQLNLKETSLGQIKKRCLDNLRIEMQQAGNINPILE